MTLPWWWLAAGSRGTCCTGRWPCAPTYAACWPRCGWPGPPSGEQGTAHHVNGAQGVGRHRFTDALCATLELDCRYADYIVKEVRVAGAGQSSSMMR